MAQDSEAERPPERESMDHLAAAGQELVAAARGFLDAVEGALADPERVSAAVGSLTGLIEQAGSAMSRLMDERARGDDAGFTDEAAPPSDDRRPSRRLRGIDVEFSDGGSSHVDDDRADI